MDRLVSQIAPWTLPTIRWILFGRRLSDRLFYSITTPRQITTNRQFTSSTTTKNDEGQAITAPNGGEQVVSEKEYSQLSERTLEDLYDKFDAILGDKFSDGADVSLNNGVLTIVVNADCTYVINKQTPNRQIWFSSPFSGPKRFDLSQNNSSCWIERHTKVTLHDILSEEFSRLLKKSIKW